MKLKSLKKSKVFERFDKQIPKEMEPGGGPRCSKKIERMKLIKAKYGGDPGLGYVRVTKDALWGAEDKELEDPTLFMERKRKKQRRWEPTNPTKRVTTR